MNLGNIVHMLDFLGFYCNPTCIFFVLPQFLIKAYLIKKIRRNSHDYEVGSIIQFFGNIKKQGKFQKYTAQHNTFRLHGQIS